ncbi:MAG: N-acetylgalactosamine 6-sulfate sulfatase [Planctomycetaceae bacterium]|nr:N-acetylgalactosamine 6-sulfate sulfatase [Planctomycetaceae bacterium]
MLALFGLVLLGGVAPAAEPARKPNVVFILADDLGWADLTPYGSTFHDTPNLQRLADRSVRFTNYYAASPLCSPTRSSILTGLYPARTGITAPVCHLPTIQLEKRLVAGSPKSRVLQADSLTRLKGEYVTLAEVFKESGYATAHFGKWHLGHGDGYEPKDQGFDADIPHTPKAPGPGGGYFAPWKFITDPQFKGKPGEHIDEWMAGEAAKFIAAQKGKPFFLNFWLYSVHSPWNGDPKLIEQFKKTTDPKAAQRNPVYAAMLKNMDNTVGKLLDSLDAAKVADDTIIVFTSDNGGWAYPPKATDPKGYEDVPATSNAPLRSGKASNYEGGTRVPCLVAWPGKAKAGTSDALFSSVDWFPTLLAMTGVKPKSMPKVDGVDQTSAILGQKPVRDTVYVHFPHGSETQEVGIPGFWPATWVRKGDWKLIRFYAKNDNGTDSLELYNLKDDIGETKNLAAENPALVKELAALINAFLKDTEAVVPKANPGLGKQPAAGGAGVWTPGKDAAVATKDGVLVITSTGGDPFIVTRDLPAGTGPYTVEFKMKSGSRGTGQIMWTTADDKGFHRDRSATFEPKHDGEWHDYAVKLPTEKALTGLRLDPATAAGEIRLEAIKLKDKDGKAIQSWPNPPAEKK